MGPGSSYRTMTRRRKQTLCLLFAICSLILAVTGMCPAGTYRAINGSCINCTEGVAYTDIDDMDACLPCGDCESAGQMEVSPCTPTQNTECGCEAGKCLTDDSPEHCVPCPRSEAHQHSPTATTGNLTPSRDPSSPEFHKTQFPRHDSTLSSLNKHPNGTGNVSPGVGLGLGLGLGGFFVLLAAYIIYHQKKNMSQAFLDLRNSLCSVWARCRGHSWTASEIGQNDLNEKENLTEIESYDESQGHDGWLLDTVDLERELESPAQAPLPAKTAQALGDPEQLSCSLSVSVDAGTLCFET